MINPGDSVLVTRPEPGASDTAARLRRMGLQPVVAPMLRIGKVTAELPDPAQVQAVLVTSANALPMLPMPYRRRPLLTVGAATATHATELGFAHVVSADGDARALAALVRARCRVGAGDLVLATGRGHGDKLAASLGAAGFSVRLVTVYAARPADMLPNAALNAWRDGSLRAALFFSAETARAFVRLVGGAEVAHAAGVAALAIAPAVAAALAPLPWRLVRVADNPTQDAMLALLK